MDVMIAAGGTAWEAAAIREIETSATLRLVRRCVDVADLLAAAHSEVAATAIVSADLVGLDVDAVHRLERAGVRVATIDADSARCGALGISRILRLGSLDEIARDVAVTEAVGDIGAPVIAVWGPAGAPGRSTVALGLAAATAARGVDTLLVDADTYGGALGQMLGMLDDVSGLVAACRAANQGRPAETADHLLEVDPRLRLLTGLPRADMWSQVRAGAWEAVLAQVRLSGELVIVDCGFAIEAGHATGGRNQATLHTLEQANQVIVVGRPDPVGLARLIRAVHDLGETAAPIEGDRIVVVNQMRSSLGWSQRDIRTTISRLAGHEVQVFLPCDQQAVDRASMAGRTVRDVAGSSGLASGFDALASQVLVAVSPGVVLAAARQ